MPRYIDADKIEAFGCVPEIRKEYDAKSFDAGVLYVLKSISSMPTVNLKDIWKSQWISPKKQLPQDERDVFLCLSEKMFAVGYFDTDDNEWYRYCYGVWVNCDNGEPLYWMPLPKAPEDD